MKKIIIALLLLAGFQNSTHAQTQDLISLAKGQYMGFNAIFDINKNLYGYVSLYGYGKSGEKTKKFEYVILDKNLNPVANKEFQGDISAADYYAYMDFKGQIILRPTQLDYTYLKTRDMFTPSSMVIDVNKNTISKKIYYDFDGQNFLELTEPKNWKQEKKDFKAEKKEKGYNYLSGVYEIKEGGFLVIEMNDYGDYINNNSLIRYNENKEELWRYKYNTSGDKKNKEFLRIIEKDENNIYAFLEKISKKDKEFHLLVIDMKTGKEKHNKLITSPSTDVLEQIQQIGNLDNSKTFDDKIVLLGRNIKSSKYIGFVRMMIDKNNFSIDVKSLNYENDLDTHIPKLDDNGGVEGGYYLIPKDLFFLKNGSIGILMEKYKEAGQYSASKTTDLVYIYTDKDFKVSGVTIFDKEKTRWFHSDYLFSQYLNNGNDVVFFYKDNQKDDKTKEKNWNLFINTLIDGKFNQEQIPISSKENIIYPYVAKEGYILMQEYNEKEKYNKIRLEKLNY
jgi:GTP:adenosylcobinamide-phosphate guanylyltransferase